MNSNTDNCVWEQQDEAGTILWQASCGPDRLWSFSEAGDDPDDHGMKFCPYCGKRIAQVRQSVFLYSADDSDFSCASEEPDEIMEQMADGGVLVAGAKFYRGSFVPIMGSKRMLGTKLAYDFCERIDEIIAEEIENFDYQADDIPEWAMEKLGRDLRKFIKEYWPVQRFVIDDGTKAEEITVTEEDVKRFLND